MSNKPLCVKETYENPFFIGNYVKLFYKYVLHFKGMWSRNVYHYRTFWHIFTEIGLWRNFIINRLFVLLSADVKVLRNYDNFSKIIEFY